MFTCASLRFAKLSELCPAIKSLQKTSKKYGRCRQQSSLTLYMAFARLPHYLFIRARFLPATKSIPLPLGE